jgi:hypothetical protein
MRMRVLFASDAAAYRDEVVSAFERHRPHFCMRSVEPGDLTLEAPRFRPHLMVLDGADLGTLADSREQAWVQLFRRVPTFAIVQMGGRYRRVENVGVEDLLAIADEVEEQGFSHGP